MSTSLASLRHGNLVQGSEAGQWTPWPNFPGDSRSKLRHFAYGVLGALIP